MTALLITVIGALALYEAQIEASGIPLINQ